MFVLNEILALLSAKDQILLTTHQHPDGDGLGSMFALGQALRKRGKSVYTILTEDVPSSFAFLNYPNLVFQSIPDGCNPSMLVALDCGDADRMALPNSEEIHIPIVNIDHHISNSNYGAWNLVVPEAAATGELVYKLLVAGGYELDQQIAMALYVAIATDTGFFRYTNAGRDAFLQAAELVRDYRLDPAKIAEIVHEQKTLNAIMLLGEVLGTLTLAAGGKVAWMYLSHDMLQRYPVELEETEGFVNYARSIIGVEIALFFKETQGGEVRISWRSGPEADVSQLAANFGGGGHARAAGCTINGSLRDSVDVVLDFLASNQEVK